MSDRYAMQTNNILHNLDLCCTNLLLMILLYLLHTKLHNGGIFTVMVDYTIICNIKTVMLPLYHIFIDK